MLLDTLLIGIVLLAGLYMAWSIGANDVANAMGTSVGSGALTLRQAILVAAVLEFCGAFFFGSHVSETIQRGIIDLSLFEKHPFTLAMGMFASLLSAGIWLQIASYYGWPVSTTHSIVGAVIGFGIAVGGVKGIYWDNVEFIAFSWILSPILGGILSFLIFSLIRKQIFRSQNPIAAAKRLFPIIVFFVVFILCHIGLFEGLKNLHLSISLYQSFFISGAIGLLLSLIGCHFLRKMKEEPFVAPEGYLVVERIFSYLQIMSACFMAFAHGANDVANAIGPLAAAYSILTTGVIAAQTTIPSWLLAFGGFGIVLGLSTWGWRVIETIGKKITELTPTRGFSAEFGAALTILIASQLGLPISTTHTLVGSVLGIGFARGIEALDMSTIRYIILSWIVTIPAGAFLAVLLFYLIDGMKEILITL